MFFGTPAFAVPTLDALLASRAPRRRRRHAARPAARAGPAHERCAGQGPGARSRPADSAAAALEGDRSFLPRSRRFDADLGVVAAYGKILTDAVLAIPRLGMINVHASLLPRYRGAAPVHRAVIAGERETGVTIMRVVKALDAGPMLAAARRPIGADETSDDVERDLAQLGASAAGRDASIGSPSTACPESPQNERRGDLRATPHEGRRPHRLVPARASDLHNQIRGLHPWPHASRRFSTASD